MTDIATTILNATQTGVFDITVFENPEINSTNVVVTVNTDSADKILDDLENVAGLEYDETINNQYELDIWYIYTDHRDPDPEQTPA